MVGNRMECGTHAQANCRSEEETGEDEDVLMSGLLETWLERVVEEGAGEDCEEGAEEMGPDVDGFVVEGEDAVEGFGVGV